ncbi:hypothetical protein S40285_00890 [Stachybotrys chlorohalonatus IBT 40285]|uniref:Zn(2)-C6 fungal-type domain-containing protein n=1 Tax=Stachybotrys chlorohalonatus (strain IBT 40285) TaxID=1283841 RepID=A0A084QJQ5_STAC4|nr:hypothetical protein S40285_00890 [Stachybotrys chlorohalonata IBT 40285]
MPPRRSHKKSRAGCRRCKIRKIKCDEVHPRCGNCAKHGVQCDFHSPDVLDELASPATPTISLASAATPVPVSVASTAESPLQTNSATLAVPQTPSIRTSPVPASPTPLFSQPSLFPQPISTGQIDRLMELRLMHHYVTVTSKTLLASSTAAEDIWRVTVPQMAFEGRGYLADAILSVAALHIRSQTPDDKAIVRASHAYAASTFSEYCASLNGGITPENAEALFLTASLIAFQATAVRLFVKDDIEPGSTGSGSRYTLPMAWFHAFQGVKTVVASSWQWVRNSTVVKVIIESQPGLQLDLNPLGPNSFFGHLLEGLEQELAGEDPQLFSATAQAYAHAVSVLNYTHKTAYAPTALAFPATVSRRFIDLVEAKRPRALAIIACFFALLKRLDDVWWLHDVARREVMGLVSLFETGSQWWRHLEWPIRIALWEGGPISPDVWGVKWNTDMQPRENMEETMVSHIELMVNALAQQAQAMPSMPATPGPEEWALDAASPD